MRERLGEFLEGEDRRRRRRHLFLFFLPPSLDSSRVVVSPRALAGPFIQRGVGVFPDAS